MTTEGDFTSFTDAQLQKKLTYLNRKHREWPSDQTKQLLEDLSIHITSRAIARRRASSEPSPVIE
jgi:hypothetical protein